MSNSRKVAIIVVASWGHEVYAVLPEGRRKPSEEDNHPQEISRATIVGNTLDHESTEQAAIRLIGEQLSQNTAKWLEDGTMKLQLSSQDGYFICRIPHGYQTGMSSIQKLFHVYTCIVFHNKEESILIYDENSTSAVKSVVMLPDEARLLQEAKEKHFGL